MLAEPSSASICDESMLPVLYWIRLRRRESATLIFVERVLLHLLAQKRSRRNRFSRINLIGGQMVMGRKRGGGVFILEGKGGLPNVFKRDLNDKLQKNLQERGGESRKKINKFSARERRTR